MGKINYVVAFYIGENRGYDSYKQTFRLNPTFFLDKHVDFINTQKSISLSTFVFNDDICDEIKIKISKACENINLNIPYEIVYRKNSGFSYGIWNDIIKKNMESVDYFFLIEDDYIPCDVGFIEKFNKFVTNETPYICGFADTVTDQSNPEITSKGIYTVPSISNGMIKSSICKLIYDKYNSVFKLNYNSDYPSAWDNQICFYKYFFDEGYAMGDILSEYSSPFLYVSSNQLKIFGNSNFPALISPIHI